MKVVKRLLLTIIAFLILPNIVNAASGTINITGSGTVVTGNTVTLTVTLSSNTKMGSWQMDLDYDKAYLQLIRSTSESGGTSMAASSAAGDTSKSYTFTFKALKSGTTNVKVARYLVYENDISNGFKEMSITSNGKSIRLMTQAELEATYSSDATLKSITLSKGELEPKFNRNTYTYNVEVPNDVTSIRISATKNDYNATVTGGGEVELEEGENTVTFKVVAQKGNEQVYTINIYRKELDPIEVNKDGVSYKVVRKANLLKNTGTFKETTITIQDTEIPALTSEYTKITLVGIKDVSGEVKMYVYDNGLKDEYHELTDNQTSIIPIDLVGRPNEKIYQVKEFDIKDVKVKAYYLPKHDDEIIIYGKDTSTGNDNYYLYDLLTDTYTVYRFNSDDYYQEVINNYKYMLYGAGGIIFLLLLIAIFKKGKPRKVKKKDLDLDYGFKKSEEEKEEEKELKEDNSKKNKKKKETKQEVEKIEEIDIGLDEIKEEPKEVVNDETKTVEIDVIKNANRKLSKKEKKLAKEQQKLIEKENKKKLDSF